MRAVKFMTVVWMICLTAAAWAASDKSAAISSTSLQILEKTGDIRFEGNVEVRMDEIVLFCDFLTVKTDNVDPSSILSGKALGNVVLTKGNDMVEAGEAVFDLEGGKVELTGAPRLVREDTIIEAKKIDYSLEDGSISFQGSVRATFKVPGE